MVRKRYNEEDILRSPLEIEVHLRGGMDVSIAQDLRLEDEPQESRTNLALRGVAAAGAL